ncbi:hypothetical protein [Burkholderia sp. AU45388]|uniref:hypothetical protein n=1 Tax=Burkholderia sp. AU45388 TaxID=3059206 RepID=UPI00265343F6|nr:hypothetical protein [Burkholderia sp. AU45388]MDN7430768.1 hypothetical protein [Burkholderia sp. AU45388]
MNIVHRQARKPFTALREHLTFLDERLLIPSVEWPRQRMIVGNAGFPYATLRALLLTATDKARREFGNLSQQASFDHVFQGIFTLWRQRVRIPQVVLLDLVGSEPAQRRPFETLAGVVALRHVPAGGNELGFFCRRGPVQRQPVSVARDNLVACN